MSIDNGNSNPSPLEGIGNSGGPGKPEATPIGSNIKTGGPGLPGTINPQNLAAGEPSSKSNEEFIAKAHENTLALMIGGSGGTGNIPKTLEEAKTKKMGPTEVLHELETGHFRNLPLDEMTKTMLKTNSNFAPMLASAQEQGATIGVVVGTMANGIKLKVFSTMGGRKAWPTYRKQHIEPHINPSTLRLYMDCASIGKVEKYLRNGIDRLGKLYVVIKDNGLERELDPVNTILSNLDPDISLDVDDEKFKVYCDSAIKRNQLAKQGLDITFKTLCAFYGCGLKIEKEDIAEMLHRKGEQNDPASYLVELMDDPDNRQKLLTHKQKEEKSNGDDGNKGAAKKHIKDVNGAIQRCLETVCDYLKVGNSETPINEAPIDTMIETLHTLKSLVRSRSLSSSKPMIEQANSSHLN